MRKLLVGYVARKHIKDFKHHVLKYSFQIKNKKPTGIPNQVGRLLLLESDLEPFLRKLQILVYAAPADLVYLVPPSDQSGALGTKQMRPEVNYLTSIVVNETPFRRKDKHSDQRLLKHFIV